MTKKFRVSVLSATLALLLSGCAADRYPGGTETGAIELTLEIDPTTLNGANSRSTLEEIGQNLTVDDFTVRLTDAEGKSQEWPFSAFDGSKVKTGTYTITAYAGTEGDEGFNRAYFEGKTEVTVAAERTTQIALTATLANAGMTVKYTDAFKSYMKSYSAEVRSEGEAQGVIYPAGETDPIFVNAGEKALYVTVTNQQDKTATLKVTEFAAQARHMYNVTVDVNNGNIGSAILTISFDDSTVAETKEFELSEELFNCPPPTLTPDSYTVNVTEGTQPEGQWAFNVMAYGGLGEVKMTTSSEYLDRMGWPAEIDLLKATAEQQNILKNNGLSALGVWNNPDKMAVIDFTNVVHKLRAVSGNNTTTFTLEVVDKYGKVCETTSTMTINLTPYTLIVNGQEECVVGATTATLNITFNGGDPSKVLSVRYKNDRGTTDPSSITKVVDNGNGTYAIDITIPCNDKSVVVEISTGAVDPVTYTVTRADVDFTATAPVNSIFAKKAVLVIDAGSYTSTVINAINVSLSPASGQKAVSGSNINLSALTPGTEYTATLTLGSKQQVVKFTTEAATQLPNGNMETWCQPQSKGYWVLYYPGASAESSAWGTNNPMTTVNVGGSWNYAYDKISGTISTTDAKSGTAALLRTVGWGPSNSAIGSMSGIMKYADAGLLHLGSSRESRPSGYSDVEGALTTDDLNCGLAFASRPSSMSLWYKYVPKNSADHGIVEVYVYGTGDVLLASATKDLTTVGTYTQVTLPLNYAANAGKASKIYVKILSTYDRTFLAKNSNNFTPPPFANVSDGTYMGSQLYIDEITLNY